MAAIANENTRIVVLDFLEGVDAILLEKLLAPFRGDLALLRVGSIGSPSWLERLQSAFNNRLMPFKLQETLLEVADLATERGHELIVGEAMSRGIVLSPPGAPALSKQELSVSTYLFHRTLFAAAHARLDLVQKRVFWEYYGPHLPSPACADETLAELRHRLAAQFRAENRTHFCEVLSRQEGVQTVWEIRRGGILQTEGVIDADGKRSVRTFASQVDDLVIYNASDRRLSISTASAYTREQYRSLFGLMLAGDPDLFRMWPTFTGEPFKHHGAQAFGACGIHPFRSVVLSKLSLAATGNDSCHLVGRDLSGRLDQLRDARILETLQVLGWQMSIELDSVPSPIEAEVVVPNEIHVDERMPMDLLREFLCARGFAARPPEHW